MTDVAVTVSARGAARWRRGHPWIFRSDVEGGRHPPGIVRVVDGSHRVLGRGLWSPASEIRLRMLTSDDVPIDGGWWAARLREAERRRATIPADTTAYRLVHAEGDGLPSLVVDRYGAYVVAQLLSAGLEAVRGDVLGAIETVFTPKGLVLRNDVPVRARERLPLGIEHVIGDVPDPVEVREHGIRYFASPLTGQKTGAFLDQRENRARMGALARGRVLDVFTYHGLFALHMARRADHVLGVDASGPALDIAERNRSLNGLTNVEWREANAFELLRELERAGERFDTIVLDPPAFAKDRRAVSAAMRGYQEINLRALRLLAPGGCLFTASCSHHVGRDRFLAMLAAAAADSGRTVALAAIVGQSSDHPELLTVPETGYLKGAIVRASA